MVSYCLPPLDQGLSFRGKILWTPRLTSSMHNKLAEWKNVVMKMNKYIFLSQIYGHGNIVER